MLSLKIHHNVHLTKEQRYSLHNGEDVVSIGCAIPVWDRNGDSNEPAKEFFCVYSLKNPKIDAPIRILDNGFEITLPFRESSIPDLSDEDWRDWSFNHPEKLEAYYKSCRPEISSMNLLEYLDGGSKSLYYREHNKIKKNDEFTEIWHYVDFKSMDHLEDSIMTHLDNL